LDLAHDQDPPQVDSIDEDNLDRTPDDPVIGRPDDLPSQPPRSFASAPPPTTQFASSQVIGDSNEVDLWSLVHMDAQQQTDPLQRHGDEQPLFLENPQVTPASDPGPIAVTAHDASFSGSITPMSHYPDEMQNAPTPQLIDSVEQPPSPAGKRLDRAVGRPRPVMEPRGSQVGSLTQRQPSDDDLLDSASREVRDPQRAIDDLAGRVAQLETAQFIRGRL